jgi:hypothetical protein
MLRRYRRFHFNIAWYRRAPTARSPRSLDRTRSIASSLNRSAGTTTTTTIGGIITAGIIGTITTGAITTGIIGITTTGATTTGTTGIITTGIIATTGITTTDNPILRLPRTHIIFVNLSLRQSELAGLGQRRGRI